MLSRPGHPARPVVHLLAGARLDRADAAGRAARRLCLRPLRLPRQAAAAGGRHRAVRAADRRRRVGVPGAAGARRLPRRAVRAYGWTPPCGRSCSRTSSSTTPSSYGPSAGCGRSSTRGRRRPPGCWAPGRFAAWRRVTLPALAPAVAAAALMVFLFTFTSFGVVQILGGPAYSTLEVEIYRQTAAAPRPAHGRRADAGAVRRGRRDPRRARLDGAAPGDRAAAGRRRRRPPAGRAAPAQWALLGGVLADRRGADPAAARRAGGALAGRARRLRPRPTTGRCGPWTRRRHLPGRAARGGRELAAVRRRRHRHRAGRRRPRGGGADAAGRAGSCAASTRC